MIGYIKVQTTCFIYSVEGRLWYWMLEGCLRMFVISEYLNLLLLYLSMKGNQKRHLEQRKYFLMLINAKTIHNEFTRIYFIACTNLIEWIQQWNEIQKSDQYICLPKTLGWFHFQSADNSTWLVMSSNGMINLLICLHWVFHPDNKSITNWSHHSIGWMRLHN